MFLIDLKSICVPAGLEYFWVRNNISLYCGALSRVFAGRFFVESFSIFPTSSWLCFRRAMNVALPAATLKLKLLTNLSNEEKRSHSTMLALVPVSNYVRILLFFVPRSLTAFQIATSCAYILK